ncbi:hypothetical protein OSTOST_15493, partial [Ostertagia ostertagi]
MECTIWRMKSPCHIMIVFTCAADLVHEIGQYPFVYLFFRNGTMIQSRCFWMQLIPMIGACAGSPLILCLGLDRFAAVRFPSRLVQCAIPQSFGVVAFDLLNQIGIAVNVAIVVVTEYRDVIRQMFGYTAKVKKAQE